MKHYNKILPWENTRRLNKIMAFRESVVEWHNNCKWDCFEPVENVRARELRPEINFAQPEIKGMVWAAGVGTTFYYGPPPAVGGLAGPVELLDNVFRLAKYGISYSTLIDQLERAYGIYKQNRRPARLRAINPFFYLGWMLDLLAEIPFAIIGAIGFDRSKAEGSLFGRLAKGVFKFVGFLAALLTILSLLGLVDRIREALFGPG